MPILSQSVLMSIYVSRRATRGGFPCNNNGKDPAGCLGGVGAAESQSMRCGQVSRAQGLSTNEAKRGLQEELTYMLFRPVRRLFERLQIWCEDVTAEMMESRVPSLGDRGMRQPPPFDDVV